MKTGGLKDVTGKFARSSVKWLHARQMGCCSICFATDDRYNYSVCIGWHDGGHGCEVAWKIGRQTTNNIMQCDFDVDFEMPYDETGDVDDTLETVECAVLANRRRSLPYSAPRGYRSWDALAARMRGQARRVFKNWKDEDE